MRFTQRYLSGDLTQRLAAIDIGTNSIRLVVAEAQRGGQYRVLDEERVATRLGRSLQATGRLDEQAMAESLAALRRFRQIVDGFHVSQLRTIATCAVREAENGLEFCRRVREQVGLEVEVITAEKEAWYAFYSVQRSFDLAGKNIALADIGGGSTEIELASGGLIEAVYTTDLGAVRMTELYGDGQALIGDEYGRITRGIAKRLRSQIGKPILTPHFLIGSGGTFTSLASMVMAKKNQAGLPQRGYEITRAEVRHLLDELRKLPLKNRREVPGLNADRADIIVAGLAIIDQIMGWFDVNTVQTHSRGIRDGLLLSMLDEAQGGAEANQGVDRDAAVDRFATACHADVAHGRHVAMLAGQIFSQLADRFSLEPADQAILETAAKLQDVGYLINYDQHHKHSYHLILNSRLPGFQPHELELIANVARYHRGAEPKKKHANFRQLSHDDRTRVTRLASILRLADGLNRSHSGQVKRVTVDVAPEQIELIAHAETYPDVDIWGTRRRAGLFEKAFDVPLHVRWAQPSQSSSDGHTYLQSQNGEAKSDDVPELPGLPSNSQRLDD